MEMATTPPSLPNELLQVIVRNLDKVDLKNARLACKTLASMAEPILFRELVLVPYQDCLEEFVGFDKSGVTRHTTTLIYDTRWRYISHPWRNSAPVISEMSRDLERLGFRQKMDQSLELLYLVRCLTVLPELRSIRILELDRPGKHDHPPALPPSYFTRCMKATETKVVEPWEHRVRSLGYSGSIVGLLALSASHKSITHLHMAGIDSQLFLIGVSPSGLRELGLLANVLRQITSLHLSFQFCNSLVGIEEDQDRIALILKLARNLQVLHLEFPDRDPRIADLDLEAYSWLSSLVRDSDDSLRQYVVFPKLEHLSLGSLVCQEEELLAFVQGQQKTLQTLSISNIVLQSDFSPYQDLKQEPCWVCFFKGLRKCKIPDVQVGGFLYNCAVQEKPPQRWVVEESNSDPTSLKSRLQQWVTGRIDGECPLNPLAVRKFEEGDTLPTEDSDQQPMPGDSSWTILGDVHDEMAYYDEEGLSPVNPFLENDPEEEGFYLNRLHAHDYDEDEYYEDEDDDEFNRMHELNPDIDHEFNLHPVYF